MTMNELTLDCLKVVVSVCAALVTVYLIPYLKTLKEDKRYSSLVDIVAVAVRAAEQTFKASGTGPEKKEEVMHYVADWMTQNGIRIDTYQLDQLIECAVYQMKQGECYGILGR